MSRRARSKAELLDSIREQRAALERKFGKLTPEQMVWPGSMDHWSVKDILAHLVDWEQRLIEWFQAGVQGKMPPTPAPGMSWRDLPKLNELGYQEHKEESLSQVMKQYRKSYQQVMDLVEGMTAAEIFEPGYYAWTGDSALLPWIAANTSSHYNWARRNIRTTVIRKNVPD